MAAKVMLCRLERHVAWTNAKIPTLYRSFRPVLSTQHKHGLSTSPEEDGVELITPEPDNAVDIERLRDVSRLPAGVRARMRVAQSLRGGVNSAPTLGQPAVDSGLAQVTASPLGEREQYASDVEKRIPQRHQYARLGPISGLDHAIAWPTKKELSEMIEFEQEFEPTLQERWDKLHQSQKEELELMQKKQELVEKQMGKMPELIQKFKEKLAKVDETERKQDQKRKTMMEEARDYFGYSVDPRDPRFKQMQERKAEEELKMKKKKKKEEKELRLEKAMERIKAEIESQKSQEKSE